MMLAGRSKQPSWLWQQVKAHLGLDGSFSKPDQPMEFSDPMAQEIPAGVAAKKALDEWLGKEIVDRAAAAGYPNLGAAAATVPSVIGDLLIPQTAGDAAAMPFGKFTKGVAPITKEAAAAEKATGLATGAEREMSMKRQNAIQATREALERYKAAHAEKMRQAEAGVEMHPHVQRDIDAQFGKLGSDGIDMGAWEGIDRISKEPSGVVTKSARLSNASKRVFDDPEGWKRQWLRGKNMHRDPAPYTPADAQDQLQSLVDQYFDRTLPRLGRKEKLLEKGAAPETFLVETPSGAGYLVQDKATRTLYPDMAENLSKSQAQDVIDELSSRARRAGVNPHDLHADNIGRYGDLPDDLTGKKILEGLHPYKIIDSGHFPDTQDRVRSLSSPRYIKPPKR